MWVVFGLSYEKTPHSKLELRNRLEPTFISPIVEEDFSRNAPTKGKRKNFFKCMKNLKTMISSMIILLGRSLRSPNL